MDLDAFDYHLPPEQIAQQPLAERSASRMLVVDRARGQWQDRKFSELPSFLGHGDCLVLNDSRVFPSRLYGHRAGTHALPVGKKNPTRHEHLSGTVEVFLVRPVSGDGRDWEALVHPGRKMRTGERVLFDTGSGEQRLEAEVIARGEFGERTMRFHYSGDLLQAFERIGHVPLPPYIKRADEAGDRERYQTVFARTSGSSAAPTAGLHFTPAILEACRTGGAEIAYVTLHVGLGTFQPLHEKQIREGRLHPEAYSIATAEATKMQAAKRLVAAGTTSVRTIETWRATSSLSGDTELFIRPGFEFQATGAMLTNFHLPRTSLLMLVCAFGGTQLIMSAYQHAVREGYRFYSFGDCMLIV